MTRKAIRTRRAKDKLPCRRCGTPTVNRRVRPDGYELPVCRKCLPMAEQGGW